MGQLGTCPPVIEDEKISIPLYISDMLTGQDSSEATERNLTQTSLGRQENRLSHTNGNPRMGLASGTQMAPLGSSHSLSTSLLLPVHALVWTFSYVWAGETGEKGDYS